MKQVVSRSSIIKRVLAPVALLVLVFQVGAFAQTAQSKIAAQSALVSEFDVNGLKVLVKRRPGSSTVSAGLFIRGGSRNLAQQNAGIENFMASVATEGSVKYPRAVMRRELARTGSSIGSGANYDYSVFSVASTLENFDRSWELFADTVMNPAFDPADVELTREKILTGLRNSEDDPDGLLEALVNKTVNANTPYANDPNGTLETIGRIKAEDLRAYHKKVMQTSQLLLVLVGDIDAEAVRSKIAATFGKLPRGNYKELAVPVLDFSKPTLDVTSRNLPTNYVQGVFNAPSINNPDFYAMRVATTVLRDRVFEEVRVKRNLSYAPSADMGGLAANSGNIYVSAVDANQAVGVMLDEIKKLKSVPVDPREISNIAGQFLTTYFIGQETNAAQAAELARYELNGGGWRNSLKFLDEVRKVTPADIQAVSNKYMKNLRFVVVGDPASVNRLIFLPN